MYEELKINYLSGKSINLNTHSSVGSGRMMSIIKPTVNLTNKQVDVMRVVIENLLSCVGKGSGLFYSRDTASKKVIKRYNKLGITNSMLAIVCDKLEEQDWCHTSLGNKHPDPDKRRPSILFPSEKFKDVCSESWLQPAEHVYSSTVETIILKDSGKNVVEYKDNKETDSMRSALVKLSILNASFTWMHKGEPLGTEYKRIFNNSSFSLGGRFYGPIQSIRQRGVDVKDSRLGITIDGGATCEIDYCCLHLSILLNEKGMDTMQLIDGDLYSDLIPEGYEVNSDNRHVMKRAVNIMLNTGNPTQAISAIQSILNREKIGHKLPNATKIWERVLDCFREIQDELMFDKHVGLELVRKETRMAEYVINKFLEVGFPLGIIHDSFLCRVEDEEYLMWSMIDAYKSVVPNTHKVCVKVKHVTGEEYKIAL